MSMHAVEFSLPALTAAAKSVGISMSVAAAKIPEARGKRRTDLQAEYEALSDAHAELEDALRAALIG